MNNYDVKDEVSDKYSLRGRVFQKIREDILSGGYKEGEELKADAAGSEGPAFNLQSNTPLPTW